MMVFWQQRLVFLATPKTASTAIESALGALASVVIQAPAVLKHTDVATYHRYLAPYLEQGAGAPFEVVALMRHPKAWLGSWYRTRQRDDVAEDLATRDICFDEFVQAWCREAPPEFARVGSQTDFLMPTQLPAAPHLFRYEALDGFVAFLEDRLDFAIHLPLSNVSPKGDAVLSGRTEDLLRSHGARDFALYDSLALSGA